MAENNRKCFKCGRSPNVDPSTKLYRFPKPGTTNSLRCELWAKYCFPDKQWNSEKFQQKLYSEHRMLCDRHFKRTSFSDYPTSFTKLHRFAAPDDEPPGTHASTDVGDKDHQFKKPAIPPPAGNKLPGFPLMVAGQPVLDRFDSTPIVIKKVSSNEKESSTKKYGACRCCLKEGIHNDVNVLEMLDGLNVEVSTEPSLSTLVCVLCSNFLLQAKRFRDMVAASQDTLLAAAQPLQLHTVPIKTELDIDTGQTVKEEIEDVCTESSWLSECGDTKPDVGTWAESDDSDFMTDAAVKEEVTEDPDNKMNVTAQELRIMEKMKVAELNLQIRENLSTILQYSTIIPFTTTKADQFECIYCDELFANFEIFRNHVENHNEDFDFKLQALKLLALKLDLELILRVDISNIKSKICEKEFKNIDNLVEHLINLHEKRYHNISRDPPHNVLCFNMRLEESGPVLHQSSPPG